MATIARSRVGGILGPGALAARDKDDAMALSDLSAAQRDFLERFVLGRKLDAAPTLDAKARKALDGVRQVVARLDDLGPREAALMEGHAARLRRQIAQIDRYEAAGDTDPARREIATAVPMARKAARALPEVRAYLAEAQAFAARLSEAQALRGIGGMIGDYVARLEHDDSTRSAAERRGDMDGAIAACRAEAPAHAAMMREARQAQGFIAERAAVQADLARLEAGKPGAGLRAACDEARGQLASAEGFGEGGNWSAALAMARQARDDLARAGKADALRRKTAAEGLDAGERTCRALLGRYLKSPGASVLAFRLKAAEEEIDEAMRALPDQARAATLMAAATETCLALGEAVARAAAYKGRVAKAMEQRKLVATLNDDRCVSAELAQADKALRDSARRAREGRFDDAMAALRDAERALAQAQEAADIYDVAVRRGRLALAGAIGRLGRDAEEAAPLRAAFDELSAAYAARDLSRAGRLAAEALRAR